MRSGRLLASDPQVPNLPTFKQGSGFSRLICQLQWRVRDGFSPSSVSCSHLYDDVTQRKIHFR